MKRFPSSLAKCMYCEGSAQTFDLDKHGRKLMVDYDMFWCPNCRKTITLKEVIFTVKQEVLHGNPKRQA